MDKDFQKQKMELLAPAGNMEKMKTALAFGADAVYLGIPDFSLRARVNDFDSENIKDAVRYCHSLGKRIYVTANIFAHNRHLEELPGHIKLLEKIGVDGLIVSDPGFLDMIREIWPEASLHLSTQANCTNWRSARFWQKQGVRRIILGRETALDEIREIKKKVPDIELEYFVHGAMCMAYSGRCFISKYLAGRSANLGDCSQPCRWSYEFESQKLKVESKNNVSMEIVEEEHGSYILNSKDLCLIKYLKDLADAGVTSFKIEGRAKSVYYQAVVSGIYSQALEDFSGRTAERAVRPLKSLDYYYSELETKLVHRGYTTGFLLGEKSDQNLENSHNSCDWEFCGQINNANAANSNYANCAIVKVHNSIYLGDVIEIVRPKYDIIKLKVEKMRDAMSGEEISEAHGGQGRVILLEVDEPVPEWSAIRRKISKL